MLLPGLRGALMSEDIDSRPTLFFNLTSESLSEVTSDWPRPTSAPQPVQDLLAQARRILVGGAACYDNFVQAELVALQAAELALKHRLGLAGKKLTLGALLNQADKVPGALTSYQREWFGQFALHWRNKLSHPDEAVAMTPGMAAQLVEGVHLLAGELAHENSRAAGPASVAIEANPAGDPAGVTPDARELA
jgi:hypothetical protein